MVRRGVMIGTAIALCVTGVNAFGWTAVQNVSNQPGGSRAFGPKIAADPLGNVHLVWPGGVDGAWQVWYQVYNGSVWSAPVALSGSNANRPDIAVDGNGTVHLVYEEAAERNIWYRQKPAGGSWTTPVNLRSGGRSIAPNISVNSAGTRVIVAWHEDNQIGGEWDIFVNRFNGTSWTGTTNVSSNSPLSADPKTCIDPQGNLHVGWTDKDPNGGDQYIRYRRADVNGNWGAIATVHSTSRRCGLNSLHASADGYIHAGYTDDDGTGWEIMYKYSNGSTWSAAVNVSNHAGVSDDVNGHVYSDALGRLYMVWDDLTNIYYSTAASRTSAWSGRETIVGGQYGAAAADMNIDTSMIARVVWQARPVSSSNWNIYTTTQSVGTPGPTGTLAGEVRDQYNAPVAAATVSTGNAAGITNASGQFSFSVPVGTYTVTATKPYYTSQSAANVTITQGQTTSRNFQLASIGPGPVANFVVAADNLKNVLSWTQPASGQVVGTRIRARVDGVYPSGPEDGVQVADVAGGPGANCGFTHTGLTNGVTYSYATFAYDGNTPRSYATGQFALGTPAGPGDYDRDGDVDQSDWGIFQMCLSGAFIAQTDPTCAAMRFDVDDDVDDDDVVSFLNCWSGPGNYSNPTCAP